MNKEFENYEDQKNSIEGFRTALKAFIKGCDKERSIIFFVDELDRCNPAYAVKVLERIKHLFTIPNIIFVLSVDKKQLCNAIKGYYGSESLDAENYLKRFIDIEYNLPEPSYEDFCNYLYDKFEIEKHINNLHYGKNYKSSAAITQRQTARASATTSMWMTWLRATWLRSMHSTNRPTR